MDLTTNVNALGGFITGGITANIDSVGFYAAGTMSVGFPAGATITNDVNNKMESLLHCNWVLLWMKGNWCPYVTGKYLNTQAVVSSKGVGAKASFDRFHGTVWYASATRKFNSDLGINSSKELSTVLGKRGDASMGRSKGAERANAATLKATTWVIPAGTDLAALQLAGSATGELMVKDPSGKVVFDSATQFAAEGVGFGRDPSGAGNASFGLFAPAIKPG
jgi:hypothetical protein